jgi:hypothetical protein
MAYKVRVACLACSILVFYAFLITPFAVGNLGILGVFRLNGAEVVRYGLSCLAKFQWDDPSYYLCCASVLAHLLLLNSWGATVQGLRIRARTSIILSAIFFSPMLVLCWQSLPDCPGYWLWGCSNGIILLTTLFEWKPRSLEEVEVTPADQELADAEKPQ